MALPFLGSLLSGGIGALGGASVLGALNQGRDDISALPGNEALNLQGAFGAASGASGLSQLNPQLMAAQQQLGSQLPGLFGGGFANVTGLDGAMDMAGQSMPGSFQNLQSVLGQQMGGSAFGGMGGLFSQANQLGNIFANQAAQGPQDVSGGVQGQMFGSGLANQFSSSNPAFNNQLIGTGMGNLQSATGGQTFGVGNQDFSGGMQNQLFGQGMANQMLAGNQSGLFNQSLNTQRQAATQGGLLDSAINKLQNRQFATGRLGTTGGAGETQSFLDAVARQDLGFQNNAFGQAQQQQQLLAQLGGQQMNQAGNIFGQNLGQNLGISQFMNQQQLGQQGLRAEIGLGQLGQGLGQQRFTGQLGLDQTAQGAGLLSQSLGQFNNQAGLASNFMNLAGGFEGQGFGQNLQALQQNQSAGMQRLQSAQGLLGFGDSLFGSSFNRGLGATEGLLGIGGMGLEAAALPFQLQASLLGASGAHAGALSDMASASASARGGLFGGIADTIGGLFS